MRSNTQKPERTQQRPAVIALPSEGFCSIRALAQPSGCTPWGRSSLFSLIRQGRFPAPERFSARCTRWRVEEIRRYLEDPRAWELAHAPQGSHAEAA
ncbi:MAG: AlpA family phage regulatory protein [Castellaniella sp.]|nr:MAG: AlpA family phage regulatory protein [Castellaniella sp.]